MKLFLLSILTFAFFHLTSCKEDCSECGLSDSGAHSNIAAEKPKLSAEELLSALGGHYFDVELPESFGDKAWLRSVLINSKGEVLKEYGGSYLKEGAKSARVFLFKDGTNIKQVVKITHSEKEGASRTSGSTYTYQLPEHKGSSYKIPQDKTIKPGDGMIRLLKKDASSGSIDSEKLTQEDSFDLTVILSD